jgi:hypothetical protein
VPHSALRSCRLGAPRPTADASGAHPALEPDTRNSYVCARNRQRQQVMADRKPSWLCHRSPPRRTALASRVPTAPSPQIMVAA